MPEPGNKSADASATTSSSKPHLLTCHSCEGAFASRSAMRKFCSVDCKKEFYRRNWTPLDGAAKQARKEYAASYYRANREKVLASVKEYSQRPHVAEKERARSVERRATETDKVKARTALNAAVRRGRILRGPCRDCGDLNTHGHHTDYSKALDVIWLCPMHHAAEHARSEHCE